jgi:hypothetical protein
MSHSGISPGSAALEVELRVVLTGSACRGCLPLTCGIPWPRGALADVDRLILRNARGRIVPLQARALDLWSDRTVRWALLDWQGEAGGTDTYRLAVVEAPQSAAASGVRIERNDGAVTVGTGLARFTLGSGDVFPFCAVFVHGTPAIDVPRSRFAVEDEAGRLYSPRIDRVDIDEPGPVRAQLHLQGNLVAAGAEPLTDFEARLHFFAGSAVVRFELTLRNPRKADHPGGLWDLGNGGSVYLRDATLTVTPAGGGEAAEIRYSPEAAAPYKTAAPPFELYQDSSGGENWKSSNHLNRKRVVPNTFRGYRLRVGGAERFGLRATPAVCLVRGGRVLGVAIPQFWQNFPRAIEATADSLVLRLFPRQYADVHELQGGEQKTHTFCVLFGADGSPEEALNWCREPALAVASPDWYCATGVVPYLTPRANDPNTAYLELVNAAIEGSDTFDHKREVIDEYGWRHFGDIYGDHEAVFHKGPSPLVSHYNNQYDPIAGFAYQFLRSGDPRWFRHMDELAAHVIDIDIYHTDGDKSAYNHGLFWHTYHYVDADTGTHRSYPRALQRLESMPGLAAEDSRPRASRAVYALGGGPANEQNYTAGLLLHHFLTGRPASRAVALELARWVVDMDDGRKTVFRWLASGDTGLASKSRGDDYHGPGRGAANSLSVLIDAHRLSGDVAFLTKAEQLLRRCVHPKDDVAARNLLDVENRWFYTMFLQALGRYLDHKAELGQRDFFYAYARASLLHYARWMADHERPYLDRPEILEYPNETWAAQDMRKSEIFKYAAKHSSSTERSRFLERSEFFFRFSVETLSRMPTHRLARPVVLLLSYGFMHSHFQKHPEESAPPPEKEDHDFGRPEVFVPQKARALKRFKVLAAGAAAVFGLAFLYLLSLLWR